MFILVEQHQIDSYSCWFEVEVEPSQSQCWKLERGEATSKEKTGVEMEGITAVAVTCLIAYDMCKAASKYI